MPSRNLRDGTIAVRVDDNGSASEGISTVTIEEGDLTWTERRPASIYLDRGRLDHARKAPDEAVTLSFSMFHQDFIDYAAPTPYEALKGIGDASAWISQEAESDVYATDIKFTVTNPAGGGSEVLSFDRFIAEDIVFSEGDPNRISVSGRAIKRAKVTPADLPGLRVHLDAAMITELSDTDPVETWEDLSGFNNDFAEATNKPTWQEDEINGQPVVRFDGANDLLSMTMAGVQPQPYTYFLVAQHVTGSVVADENIIGGLNDGAAGSGEILAQQAATDQIAAAAGTDAAIGDLSSSAFVLIVAFDGAASVARFDRVQTTEDVGTRNIEKIVLGADGAGSADFANVDIAEFALYNRKLTVSQMRALEDYAADKYGV